MSSKLTPADATIARAGQVALGLLWLADGLLQFQPYMFSKGFVTGVILPASQGQPGVILAPIVWSANLVEPHVALFNGGAATVQVLIGLGLLYRPAVKASLLVSFAWASGIWLVGEGLGMIFTGTATPLTGAPGAALLYLVAGLMCWPRTGAVAAARRDAVVRLWWSAIWLGAAILWLLPANDEAASVHDAIATVPSGVSWLSGILKFVAQAASGRGSMIALALALVSMSIGLSHLYRWHTKPFLGLAIAVSIGYWIVGQGFGGVFTGQATDPGSAPVMIIIASMLLAQEHKRELRPRGRQRSRRPPEAIELANSTEYGLAATVYTNSEERLARIGAAVRAGTVWVNCFYVRDLEPPFGGAGDSGTGREGGRHSFDFYCDVKTVCERTALFSGE